MYLLKANKYPASRSVLQCRWVEGINCVCLDEIDEQDCDTPQRRGGEGEGGAGGVSTAPCVVCVSLFLFFFSYGYGRPKFNSHFSNFFFFFFFSFPQKTFLILFPPKQEKCVRYFLLQ